MLLCGALVILVCLLAAPAMLVCAFGTALWVAACALRHHSGKSQNKSRKGKAKSKTSRYMASKKARMNSSCMQNVCRSPNLHCKDGARQSM